MACCSTNHPSCLHLSHFLFCFVLFFKVFVYLAVSGLSCGTQDLCCGMWDLFSCSIQNLQLRHVNSQLRHACGIYFPDQGSNLGPLRWECGVSATGPPGKSPLLPHFKQIEPIKQGNHFHEDMFLMASCYPMHSAKQTEMSEFGAEKVLLQGHVRR